MDDVVVCRMKFCESSWMMGEERSSWNFESASWLSARWATRTAGARCALNDIRKKEKKEECSLVTEFEPSRAAVQTDCCSATTKGMAGCTHVREEHDRSMPSLPVWQK